MANQNLTAMVADLYNLVGGEVGYNDYCHAMGMLEAIKAKLTLQVLGNAAGAPPVLGQNVGMQQGMVQPAPAQNVPMQQVTLQVHGNAAGAPPVLGQNVGMQQGIVQPAPAQNVPMQQVTLQVLGNAAGAPPALGQNVGMPQGIVQPAAQNVPMEQVLGNVAGAPLVLGQNVGMQQGIVQPAPAQNVPMEQGIQQQQPGIGQPAPNAIQNIIPPVPNIDDLSREVRDDWKPFDGETFDYLSPNPTFWFSERLTEYMVESCRIKITPSVMDSLVRESPPYSFVHSVYWIDRSIPVILLCPGQVRPTTPGLLFSHVEPKHFFLYWPGLSKYFKKYQGNIRVSYWWKRSRTNGRFLLLVKVAKDSQLLQSSGDGGQQTGDMTTGHSNAIGGASGSAEPQDRGETSAAGASRARHGTSPHLTRGNQLSSSRVLRSMTRR